MFDVFDKHGRGELDYKEFMAALKPDRQAARRVVTSQQSESQAIHDEIEQQVASCQCRSQFKVKRMAEGKYKVRVSEAADCSTNSICGSETSALYCRWARRGSCVWCVSSTAPSWCAWAEGGSDSTSSSKTTTLAEV